MKNSLYAAAFLVALTFAYAAPQPPTQNQGTQNASQASPASQPGQSGASAQANVTSPSQKPSSASVPAGRTDSSGAGAAGSASTTKGNAELPEYSQSAAPATSTSELQSHIQQALDREPTLAGEHVNVTVSGSSIDLSGKVGTARQKLTATRIVKSYAENRKVVNNVTIGNTTANPATPGTASESGEKANRPGRSDLSSHPEPEKGSPPGTSTRPPQ